MKPVLKLYRGYANEEELIVMGHVFRPTTKAEYDFQKRDFGNARRVIRMFRIKTQANAEVFLHFENQTIRTKTLEDGYFKFCIPLETETGYGWMPYRVSLHHHGDEISEEDSFIRPHIGKLGFISDIDDTFLMSYTRNIFKKMYVLLFRGVNDRKVFEGVVPHYQALARAHQLEEDKTNAFFYVSSSEWNLYRFIVDFTKLHQLPRAVLLLKDIKTSLMDFLVTGRGDHNHKFEKIRHIIEFYPGLHYTLIGDDSQQDPFLYESICKIFPVTVKAVYIRQTGRSKKPKALRAVENMASLNVETCYFRDSSEAIEHSRSIGLIR